MLLRLVGIVLLLAVARPGASDGSPTKPVSARLLITAVNGVPFVSSLIAITVSPGDCLTLALVVKRASGAFDDVTHDPNTELFADSARGRFPSRSVWCATSAEAGSGFLIHGRYTRGGATVEASVSVQVRAIPMPAAQLTPSSLAFSDQTVGETSGAQVATLASTGDAPLVIDSIRITGPAAGSFTVTAGGEAGTLPPGASRTIDVRFVPTGPGFHSAALTVGSNASGSPHSIPISGIGIAAIRNEPAQQASVGEPIAATGRLAIFGADPPGPDTSVTTVRGIADDGSLFILDYAGTALLHAPPSPGSPVEVLLDTTRQDLPDGIGLARLLRAEVSRSGVIAIVALRADNNRGIYRLENRRLTLLAVLPGPRGPVELTLSDTGQIAYVAPVGAGAVALFLSTTGPGTELLRQGQTPVSGITVGGIRELAGSGAGDLAFLVTRPDGSPLAILRRRGAAFESVAAAAQTVERGRGAGVTGTLTGLRRPQIGPDGAVLFAGAGSGFANFFIARPGRPLEPTLPGTDWDLDPAAFDADLAGDGSVALRAAPTGAATSALYLVAPTGGVTLLVGGRRDLEPIGQPAFGPAGRLFFLAQNSELPPDRTGHAPVGLHRVRLSSGRWLLEGVALPGQPVPDRAATGPAALLVRVTQRPVLSQKELVFGILYGPPGSMSAPTAGLFRAPLDGTLAEGALVAPEGQEQVAAGRLALLNAIAYRGDGTLVTSGLLPGAGPVLSAASAPAGIASAFRTQAETPAGAVPLVATGDLLGGGRVESALPPFVALGRDRTLFVARISPASPQPPGPSQEGLFAAGPRGQSSATVALTPRPAGADALFTGFADTQLLSLSPPSVFSDASSVNVVFKALLARGGSNLTGVFQWTGTGDPAPIAFSDRPLVPGDALPYRLDRWAAGRAGISYVLARPSTGPACLFSGTAGALKPLVDPRVTAVSGGSRLSDLTDFVLDGSGALFVTGTAVGGAGLFRLTQDQLVPVALQGGAVPPLADGRGRGLVFGDQFQLAPESARGDLIFRALVQVPRSSQTFRGEFQFLRGRLETRVLESVGVAGAREVSIDTLGDAFPSQSANGVAISASFTQRDGWILVRSLVSLNGSITSTVIAQETRGRLANVPRFAALDAGPLLESEGLPTRAGPVFTISDAGDIAFLASDGTGWGVYQVRAR